MEVQATTEATQCRRSDHSQAQHSTQQENLQNPEQTHPRAVKAEKRSRDADSHTSNERSRKRLQTQSPPCPNQVKTNRYQEDNHPSHVSLEHSPQRARPSAAPTPKTIGEARIAVWTETGAWPTKEQETTMQQFRRSIDNARAKRRSLSRKRSSSSVYTESTSTPPREQKSTPYRSVLFEEKLRDLGSFMNDHAEGVNAESEKLCQALLEGVQSPPEHTLFSDEDLFRKTCERVRGENEPRVIRDIAPLIVPSAEILADRGAKHLEVLRETVNACWATSTTFMNPQGLRPGLRPQPDFGLGFRKDAFSVEQRQKLQPYIGDPYTDSTFLSATYNMYLPFFSAEVKCGAAALDVADRQNAHTQSVILRGLCSLFILVGREEELHREITGFSISHSDTEVRIFGHYAVIDGDDIKFYRHSIHNFNFQTLNGRDKWTAYKFVRNMYDLWVPKHFKRICDVIDSLPADPDLGVSERAPQSFSTRSGLSQQLERYDLDEEEVGPESQANIQSNVQPITPDTMTGAESASSKKSRTN